MINTTIMFEGKRYPRPEYYGTHYRGHMFCSEASARLRAVGWEITRTDHDYGPQEVEFKVNPFGVHAPEGEENIRIRASSTFGRGSTRYMMVYADRVFEECVRLGLMTLDESNRAQFGGKREELGAILDDKRKIVANLQEAAFTATFGIERAKDETKNDDLEAPPMPDQFGLIGHWRDQQHTFILALEERDKAEKEYAACC